MRQRRRGVLLAGGSGSRFGGIAKGLLPLGDARLADAALTALHEACDDVWIAANDPAATAWFPDHPLVRDVTPGLGGLGALRTALDVADGAVVVVCAWDMPFVTGELLGQLAATVESGAACCVPVHGNGRAEPLSAAYAPSCAAVVAELLARGERAAHAVLDMVHGAAWPIEEMLSRTAAVRTFLNVNTPDDLRLAQSWHSLAHPAR